MVEIDLDITRAKTLPSKYYTDPQIFESILSKFKSTWNFIGHASQFEENTVFPININQEQLVITKSQGQFSCLSNICTHRGMILQHGKECKKTLTCPYHGRTFSLDGKFKHMPEFEQAVDFPSPDDDLQNFDLEIWNDLIFISQEPKSSFSKWIKDISERMSFLDLEKMSYDSSRERNYTINANWALYVDNYLEGFHIPFVHKDLNDALEYNQYETELFENSVLQIGIAQEGVPYFDIPEGHQDSGKKIAAYYWWLYPNIMLNFYPWGLSLNLVKPITVDTTEICYSGFILDEELLGSGAGGDLDKVELEDQFIVESCQLGMKSSSYKSGRYSPTMEKGVHHFHRILTDSSD
ncbi:MAG: aromatic ring-hydroxylating dioxygenase subunit alpha [Candidatus Poseidoniaceae archaeon]|mgnify:FL=1|nr:choline monooxygenase [Euryarchaeota archaeon]MBL6890925.1 aromatic ring-hydroxylating dioxygenase subunit alpha [Candidatus Poseidoniaceae archaeon]RAH07121.1 MAG: aromatic ring-hydroxylating dioxygenase subunit alpha [Euryarchaeota archaeon TMED132]|tara:strand:+ start:14214 stop:15269 length:1056 start_codon:yes stop_codon:yes gene_type:complete